MCLHCFVYLKLFSTHYNKALISVGLDLRKITKATLTLKSKQEKGTKSNLQMWNIYFYFFSNQCFLVKRQIGKRNKSSLGVSLGTRQGGKTLLCLLDYG